MLLCAIGGEERAEGDRPQQQSVHHQPRIPPHRHQVAGFCQQLPYSAVVSDNEDPESEKKPVHWSDDFTEKAKQQKPLQKLPTLLSYCETQPEKHS